MSSLSVRHPSITYLAFFAFLLPYAIAVPVPANKNFYQRSIENLVHKKCIMPKEIDLPYNSTDNDTPFSYLSTPLKNCQIDETVLANKEAYLLCKEIFDVIQNITCSAYNVTLPKIESTRWSKEVCKEFKYMEDVLPKQNAYLSGNLVNKDMCEILCEARPEFEPLCRTVLWSYDVQIQIQDALKSCKEENKIGDVNTSTKDASNPIPVVENIAVSVDQNEDVNANNAEQEPVFGNENNQNEDNQHPDALSDVEAKKITVNEGYPEALLPSSKVSDNPNEPAGLGTSSSDNKNPVNLIQNAKTTYAVQNQKKTENNIADNQKNQPEKPSVQDTEHSNSGQKVSDNNAHPKENEVSGKNQQKEPLKVTSPKSNDDNLNLPSEVADKNTNPNGKTPISTTLKAKSNKSTTVSDNKAHSSTNVENPIPSNVSEENELSNVNLHEDENESGVNIKTYNSQTSSVSDKKVTAEKPKETPESPDLSSNNIPDAELTTVQIQIAVGNTADEEKDDKEAEEYSNDTENNEGDYPKSEYELNEVSKPKNTEINNPVVKEVANSNDFPSNYDGFMNTRNNIGRVPDDIRMVSSFPEQEDSHFFFYFLSIVLILMAGYLIFHNKQKIIALIVEGRHERRRRSHGAGYKKLETK